MFQNSDSKQEIIHVFNQKIKDNKNMVTVSVYVKVCCKKEREHYPLVTLNEKAKLQQKGFNLDIRKRIVKD